DVAARPRIIGCGGFIGWSLGRHVGGERRRARKCSCRNTRQQKLFHSSSLARNWQRLDQRGTSKHPSGTRVAQNTSLALSSRWLWRLTIIAQAIRLTAVIAMLPTQKPGFPPPNVFPGGDTTATAAAGFIAAVNIDTAKIVATI